MEVFGHYKTPFGTLNIAISPTQLEARWVTLKTPRQGQLLETTEHPLLADFERYFSGHIVDASRWLPLLNGTPFQKQVWTALLDIPYGTTVGYQELAEKIQNPGASRAVGTANGQNPIPLLIPCHRVVNANGELGGYNGGIEIKASLLEFEATQLKILRYQSAEWSRDNLQKPGALAI